MKINNKNEIGKDVWGAPEGVISLTLARAVNAGARLVYVARDDARLASMRDLVLAVAPSTRILQLPAWDCLPYDRLSPQGGCPGKDYDAERSPFERHAAFCDTLIKRHDFDHADNLHQI